MKSLRTEYQYHNSPLGEGEAGVSVENTQAAEGALGAQRPAAGVAAAV